ncbi:hypothetical protein BGZ76_008573 [Entomortierella beljakovae]|nr:hypothetical protein BGZ76_008573 [Entomortierella beljakovae]
MIRLLKENCIKHAKSVFEVESDLRSFYGSQEAKASRYRQDIREKSEVGCAIAGMLKPVWKQAKIDNRRPIVAIGVGNFKDRNDGSVKANRIISNMKIQAIGERILVCYVDEFRMSISCCRCHKKVKIKGQSVVCNDPEWGGALDPKSGFK